ncbi:hypothetical protein KBB96_11355 [Luteolibacter ambystomatis]|uniref:Uncharacterized protein n=1 Tax=Luteolibacter ambystomatis TaxID=2824561 RepID=A0A975IXV4_9BACT|nr:hypothetical protein [Luteolibacter ambystomatis]QUE49469.1 hypothetical protein KBB96_11355 [Luteolibacter ambystomatis]
MATKKRGPVAKAGPRFLGNSTGGLPRLLRPSISPRILKHDEHHLGFTDFVRKVSGLPERAVAFLGFKVN